MASSGFGLPGRPRVEDFPSGASQPNLIELLERILGKGVVVLGDIRIAVADIELLRIQLRLFIASVDKAQQIGMNLDWINGISSSPLRIRGKLCSRRRPR